MTQTQDILEIKGEDTNNEYLTTIKTLQTKNFNEILISFDKQDKLFLIQIGYEDILMTPTEIEHLILTLQSIYEYIKKKYITK